MAQYGYNFPWVVIDRMDGQPTANRTDGQLLDPVTRDVVQVVDANGAAVPLRTGPYGVLANFTADILYGLAKFGDTETLVMSDECLNALEEARDAKAEAAAAREAVERVAETATEIAYFYRDGAGDIYVSDTPVLVGGGVPRLDSNGDPVVVFSTGL